MSSTSETPREPFAGSEDHALDSAVRRARTALEEANVTQPEVLFLMGTGVGLLPGRLHAAGCIRLSEVPGCPDAWFDARLHYGDLQGLSAWILEDPSDEFEEAQTNTVSQAASGSSNSEAAQADSKGSKANWIPGFPCWLAASSGARMLVHTSAGSSLPMGGPGDGTAEGTGPQISLGSLALCSDHINLSGDTPLRGIGSSELGPLFPDQTQLHDESMRNRALDCARRLGLPALEAIAAATIGPQRETPAERRFYARAGAQIAVQGLADPLLSAAHAGLSTLAISVITDNGKGPTDLKRILKATQAAAPALEDLLWTWAAEMSVEGV